MVKHIDRIRTIIYVKDQKLVNTLEYYIENALCKQNQFS